MTLTDYCNFINATTIEECSEVLAQSNQKLWVVVIAIVGVFTLLQLLITGAFSKKKGAGFWFGVVALDIILLLTLALLILAQPKIIVALGLV